MICDCRAGARILRCVKAIDSINLTLREVDAMMLDMSDWDELTEEDEALRQRIIELRKEIA